MQKGIFDKMSHIITSSLCTKGWFSVYKKRASGFFQMLSKSWRLPTLPLGIAVPSALTGLTSLFGMGRGGSPSLLPPLFYLVCTCVLAVLSGCHPVYGVRERKYKSLSCLVWLLVFQLSHPPQLKCRDISTARLWHYCLYICGLSTW